MTVLFCSFYFYFYLYLSSLFLLNLKGPLIFFSFDFPSTLTIIFQNYFEVYYFFSLKKDVFLSHIELICFGFHFLMNFIFHHFFVSKIFCLLKRYFSHCWNFFEIQKRFDYDDNFKMTFFVKKNFLLHF